MCAMNSMFEKRRGICTDCTEFGATFFENCTNFGASQ